MTMISLPSSSQVLTTLLLIIFAIFIIAPDKNKKTNFAKETRVRIRTDTHYPLNKLGFACRTVTILINYLIVTSKDLLH